jgi:hypothetical protein
VFDALLKAKKDFAHMLLPEIYGTKGMITPLPIGWRFSYPIPDLAELSTSDCGRAFN